MNKKRGLFIIGILLIIYAVYSLVMMRAANTNFTINSNSLINQEGFVPIIAPEEEIDEIEDESDTTPIADIPDRIIIPKINLDAPVVVAKRFKTSIDEDEFIQYLVPEKYAGGFHEHSAPLGSIGNTVISGHHNAYGEVFANLDQVEVGDIINLYSNGDQYQYIVANAMILEERDQPLEVKIENARWILPSKDERVTLVTCYPHDSNTHRLILVAIPIDAVWTGLNGDACNETALEKIFARYHEVYLQINYIADGEGSYLQDHRQVLMDLYDLKESIESIDPNSCLTSLGSELTGLVHARMLEVSFAQATQEGEEYQAIEKLNDTYEIILEDYFASSALSNEGNAQDLMSTVNHRTPLELPSTINAWIKEDQSLNIRQKPNAESTYMGYLSSDESTLVIGKSIDGEWLLIYFRDNFAWIKREFVSLNTPFAVIPTVPQQIIDQNGEDDT